MNKIIDHLPTFARLLLGFLFFVFGLNGFLGFLPAPEVPAEAGAFLGGLASAGYFFPLLKGTEVVASVALLSNRFVPLALTVLAPVVVQIVAFHVFLAPGGLGLTFVVVALTAYLGWAYRTSFASMLRPVAKPAVVESHTGAKQTAYAA